LCSNAARLQGHGKDHRRYAAAGAIGPVILGRAFDATGSYSSLLIFLAAALGLAAATNLLLPRYSDSFVAEFQ